MAKEEKIRTPGKFTGAFLMAAQPANRDEFNDEEEAVAALEEEQATRCYGYLNIGQRQAIMVEFRGAQGERTALGYAIKSGVLLVLVSFLSVINSLLG